MKEKLTLFIALSFMIGLTDYKQSFNDNIKLSNDITVEASELNENIINEVSVDDISNDEFQILILSNFPFKSWLSFVRFPPKYKVASLW